MILEFNNTDKQKVNCYIFQFKNNIYSLYSVIW